MHITKNEYHFGEILYLSRYRTALPRGTYRPRQEGRAQDRFTREYILECFCRCSATSLRFSLLGNVTLLRCTSSNTSLISNWEVTKY